MQLDGRHASRAADSRRTALDIGLRSALDSPMTSRSPRRESRWLGVGGGADLWTTRAASAERGERRGGNELQLTGWEGGGGGGGMGAQRTRLGWLTS